MMIASKTLLAVSFFTSLLIFISHANVRAEEINLAMVTTDVNNKSIQISVDVDDETRDLKQIILRNKTPNEKPDKEAMSFQTFIDEGIIVKNNTPYTFAKFTADNFDIQRGGKILFEVMYNVLGNKRKSYSIDLAQDQTGWKFFKDKKIITQLIAHANRAPITGTTVGAKDIEMK